MANRINSIAVWAVIFFFGSALLLGGASGLFFSYRTILGGAISERETTIIGTTWAIVPWMMAAVGLILGLLGVLPGTRRPSNHQEGVPGDRRQLDDLLTRRFRRLSIWTGSLTAITAFVVYLLRSETPKQGVTLLTALATGLGIGAYVLLIIRGIGMMAHSYLEGNRFHKGSIVVALLGSIAVAIWLSFACRGGWVFGIAVGLIGGALTCMVVLSAAEFTDWVVSGFHQGRGYQRLAVVLVLIAAFATLGCYIGATQACTNGFSILIIWWLFRFRRKMDWKVLANRVGWFVCIAAWLVTSDVIRHGTPAGTLSQAPPWWELLEIVPAVGAGLAAWGITLFVLRFFAGPPSY